MLKEIAKAGPNENIGPMPHEVPDDPTKMNIKQDKSTDIWRAERDPSGRADGPMEVQRYQLQMENVGINTFFKLPVALTLKISWLVKSTSQYLVRRQVHCPVRMVPCGQRQKCAAPATTAGMAIPSFRLAGSSTRL